MKVLDQTIKDNYALYHGDCVEVVKGIPDNSIHYSIFSPPFASLFTYSDSERDMGNCKNDDEFQKHFGFLVPELFRIIMHGRLVSVHCTDIPAMKERDGFIGLKDFPSVIRQTFEESGFIFHSRCIIWKDPLIEAVRTKSLGLMHKQIEKDSSRCRQGIPDMIITMRKPGENKELISHKGGFNCFYGQNEPIQKGIEYSHNVWRRYASPVWMDINQTNTLNVVMARDKNDERHICPLQIDTIARCVELWSNPGDIVLSPYAGIGSEGYQALKMGRKFIGVELKKSYYDVAVSNLEKGINTQKEMEMF
jgi:DNA modification methylase